MLGDFARLTYGGRAPRPQGPSERDTTFFWTHRAWWIPSTVPSVRGLNSLALSSWKKIPIQGLWESFTWSLGRRKLMRHTYDSIQFLKTGGSKEKWEVLKGRVRTSGRVPALGTRWQNRESYNKRDHRAHFEGNISTLLESEAKIKNVCLLSVITFSPVRGWGSYFFHFYIHR